MFSFCNKCKSINVSFSCVMIQYSQDTFKRIEITFLKIRNRIVQDNMFDQLLIHCVLL